MARNISQKIETPSEQAGRSVDHHQHHSDHEYHSQDKTELDMQNSITSISSTPNQNEVELEKLLADQEASKPSSMQQELFIVTDTVNTWPVKDDMSSMEFPIFSLSKNKDIRQRLYSRGGRTLQIIPSVIGAATVFDKDILIYAISQIVKAKENGVPVSRRIRIESHAFLKGTRRSTGGAAYERILDTCRRLKGTTIETNVKTTAMERTEGFSMIEDYSVTQYTKNGNGALEIELTISEWLYRAAIDYDILTLNPNYFSLTQSIERRLYELARKHCGDKPWWKCGIEILQEKCGSRQPKKFFTNDLRNITKTNNLPDYRLLIDESTRPPQAVFFTKDHRRLITELQKANLLSWFTSLMQKSTP